MSTRRSSSSSSPARLAPLLVLALAAVLASGTGTAAATSGAPQREVVQPSQDLVTLLATHAARPAPDVGAPVFQLVGARRPITGEPTVLPVIGRASGRDGRRWLRVLLPGRPNGHAGWISADDTVAKRTSWHVVVDISMRRVTVYERGRAVRGFRTVVGKPTTPTPLGPFFVEESVLLSAGDVGAPFALALSSRSNVVQRFVGGPGQIALHGLANVGGRPGTAVSHGCLRLDAAAMAWLVERIGPGVPVSIRP